MPRHPSRPPALPTGPPVTPRTFQVATRRLHRGVAALRLHRVAAVAVLLAVLAGTALGALAGPAPARAHADLVRSVPAQGQVYQRPPERLRLQFTEPVTIPVEGVRLFDSRGEPVSVGVPGHPPGDATTVDVPLPAALPDGGYTVAWRVTSADSHPVGGAFTFSVGAAGSPVAATDRAPGAGSSGSRAGPAYGVLRWTGFAALALLVGVAFFVTYAWPAGAVRRGVRRLLWLGWAASLVSGLAAFLAYGPYVADLPLRRAFDGALLATTLETRLGVALIVRTGLLILLIPALLVLTRRPSTGTGAGSGPRRPAARVLPPVAVLLVGAGLAVTWGVANHSAAGEYRVPALVSDVVHLVAMAVWLGGLVVLAGVLLPARDVSAMRTAVPAFSRSAQVSVGLLVVTGMFQLWRQVGSLPALLETPYGRLLLAKLSLVLVLLALGTLARSWVRRHYPGRPSVAVPVVRRTARPPGAAPTRPDHTPAVRVGPRAVKVGASAGAPVLKAGAPVVTAGAAVLKAGTAADGAAGGPAGRAGASTGGRTGSGGGLATAPARRVGPSDPDPHQLYHFGRRISFEIVLGLAVLGVTAALVATPPARGAYADRLAGPPVGAAGPAADPTAPAGTAATAEANRGPVRFDAGSGPAAEGLLLFDLLPRRVGDVTAHVSILDPTGRPKEVPEIRVALRLAERDLGPLDVSLRAAGPGHHLGTVTVPLPGAWEAAVTIRTSDVDQTTVRIPVTISP
ncbi:copper resistance protein CopC [Plantactinospora sp. B5E13]|uniref:copper resistance CopC/CopD family protein n=1 Tax=Plantactinospora sp. B5E13 TaxID=3153758 RepID=UPI00325D429E